MASKKKEGFNKNHRGLPHAVERCCHDNRGSRRVQERRKKKAGTRQERNSAVRELFVQRGASTNLFADWGKVPKRKRRAKGKITFKRRHIQKYQTSRAAAFAAGRYARHQRGEEAGGGETADAVRVGKRCPHRMRRYAVSKSRSTDTSGINRQRLTPATGKEEGSMLGREGKGGEKARGNIHNRKLHSHTASVDHRPEKGRPPKGLELRIAKIQEKKGVARASARS